LKHDQHLELVEKSMLANLNEVPLQLLNFVFQNLELKDKKLPITLRELFKIIKDTSLLEKCPGMCPAPEHSRTNSSRE
jgi:hypothetical protein